MPSGNQKACNWAQTGKEQHPVTCVTWLQADAYCKVAGGRLPTEAEWEKASRGGLAGKKYPWGDADPTCTAGQENTAVFDRYGNYGCGTGSTWAVGRGSNKNGYGLFDMSGNVWEWVYDWYEPAYYGGSPSADPQGPASGSYRVKRGGGFDHHDPDYLRLSRRSVDDPLGGYLYLGFRCAKSAP